MNKSFKLAVMMVSFAVSVKFNSVISSTPLYVVVVVARTEQNTLRGETMMMRGLLYFNA